MSMLNNSYFATMRQKFYEEYGAGGYIYNTQTNRVIPTDMRRNQDLSASSGGSDGIQLPNTRLPSLDS